MGRTVLHEWKERNLACQVCQALEGHLIQREASERVGPQCRQFKRLNERTASEAPARASQGDQPDSTIRT